MLEWIHYIRPENPTYDNGAQERQWTHQLPRPQAMILWEGISTTKMLSGVPDYRAELFVGAAITELGSLRAMDMTGPQDNGSLVAVHSGGRQMDVITIISSNVRMVTWRGGRLTYTEWFFFQFFKIFSYLYTQHGAWTHNLNIQSHALPPEPVRHPCKTSKKKKKR